MILGMSTVRFIQVFVVQLGVGLFFLYVAYKILKRDTKRLNRLISYYFVAVAAAMFVNVIYAPLNHERIVELMHILTISLLCFGFVFLIVFNYVLLLSEQVFSPKRQNLSILGYAILIGGLFLIPGGVNIGDETGWSPEWSIWFLLYVFIIVLGISFTYFIRSSQNLYKQFEESEMKRKWRYYQIGTTSAYIGLIGTSISNYLGIAEFRTIWAGVSFLLFLFTTWAIYNGVARQMEAKD